MTYYNELLYELQQQAAHKKRLEAKVKELYARQRALCAWLRSALAAAEQQQAEEQAKLDDAILNASL